MNDIPKAIQDIAKQFDVTVQRDTVNDCNNNGWSAGSDIYLGSFDDPEIEIVAFFHELGHTQSPKLVKRTHSLTTISCEGLAWELGLSLASELGYEWEYDSKQRKYARDRLKTYRENDDNWR
jgi:hypothetical protein